MLTKDKEAAAAAKSASADAATRNDESDVDEDKEGDDWDGWEEASDQGEALEEDEDDDGGEWIDVPHSDDDDAAGPAPAGPAAAELPPTKRDHMIEAERVRVPSLCVRACGAARRGPNRVVHGQILGPADFAAIKRLREQAELTAATLSKGQKRRRDAETDAATCVGGSVSAEGNAGLTHEADIVGRAWTMLWTPRR
jgi:hypothetical protein